MTSDGCSGVKRIVINIDAHQKYFPIHHHKHEFREALALSVATFGF